MKEFLNTKVIVPSACYAKYIELDGKLHKINRISHSASVNTETEEFDFITWVELANQTLEIHDCSAYNFYVSTFGFEEDSRCDMKPTLLINFFSTKVGNYYYDGKAAREITWEGEFSFDDRISMDVNYNGIIINHKNTYNSTRACYDMHDYIEVDGEGNEIRHKARLADIMLTDDQKKLIDEFDALLKKMEEAHIYTYFDGEDYTLRHCNGEHISETSYSGDVDDEQRNFSLSDAYKADYGKGGVTWVGCDDVFVMKD